MDKVLFSRETDHWRTPKVMYNKFMSEGYYDPCPFHCEEDNLNKDYKNMKLFINPPYSDIKSWVDSIIRWYNNGCRIMLLIPSRTDTRYFHKLVGECNCALHFIKGRLHFNEAGPAPFPSVLIEVDKKCEQSYTLEEV